LSDKISYENGFKQRDPLPSLFFNFALQYVIRIVQEYEVDFELNEIKQLLVNDDITNLLGDSVNKIKENSVTLLEASRGIGLDVNAEKTKHMITSGHPK
jgi:hypothetical protein